MSFRGRGPKIDGAANAAVGVHESKVSGRHQAFVGGDVGVILENRGRGGGGVDGVEGEGRAKGGPGGWGRGVEDREAVITVGCDVLLHLWQRGYLSVGCFRCHCIFPCSVGT